LLLQSDECNILLDCGSGVLTLLQNYIDLEQLDAVVLSHYHWDHIADIGCLQYAARVLMDLGKRHKPLHIYGHTEDDYFNRLAYLSYSEARSYTIDSQLTLADFNFTFSRNVHPDPCFSMRIEENGKVLVYIADTEWTDNLVKIAQGADLLMCESSLYDEYIGRIPGHLTSGEAGVVAAEGRVKKLVLNHLPHFGDHRLLVEQARKKYDGPVELAETGKIWEL
jgi:ribonuclease BN (tRNA processing enzyme)